MSPRKYVLTLGKPSEKWQPDYRSSPLPSLYKELPFDTVPPGEFEIQFRSFCLSGDFVSGKKNILETIDTAAGILHENVGVTLDYLIVGENPSKGWKFGNYGNKINRAIEIRHHAKNPLIIREADFLALTAPATSPADLLDRVLTGRLRSTALLNPFAGRFTNGWACCLPAAMRPALDIRQTVRTENRIERLVWTQGKSFEFSVGDTLYDCQQAYELPWAEALHHIGYCLQVREVFADVVGFDILIPDPEKKALIKQQRARATQSEFVRLLITGTCSGIENDAV